MRVQFPLPAFLNLIFRYILHVRLGEYCTGCIAQIPLDFTTKLLGELPCESSISVSHLISLRSSPGINCAIRTVPTVHCMNRLVTCKRNGCLCFAKSYCSLICLFFVRTTCGSHAAFSPHSYSTLLSQKVLHNI